MPPLEIIEVVLIQSNIVNNDFQQDTRSLYTLLDISPKNVTL